MNPWKRLLAFIPTVICVLIFLLWVQQLYDPQINLPIDATTSHLADIELLEKVYKQQGLDKPIFFVSIMPKALTGRPTSVLENNLRKKMLRAGLCVAVEERLTDDPASLQLYNCQRKECIRSWAKQNDHIAIFPRKTSDILPVFRWHWENQFSAVFKSGFGTSTVDGISVGKKIVGALRWTLILNVLVVIIGFLLGIILGLYSALNVDRWVHKLIKPGIFFFYTLPSFVLASACVIFLSSPHYGLALFPKLGFWSYVEGGFLKQVWANRTQFLAPLICLVLPVIAYIASVLQESIAHELRQKYVWYARLSAVSMHRILWRHVLPNIRYPIAALASNIPIALVSGMIVVEVICNFPGLGRLLYTSVLEGDWPVVRGIVVLAAIMGFAGLYVTDLVMHFWHKKSRAK